MFNYVLIAVGLIIVAGSFFLSEKLDKKLGGSGSEEAVPQIKEIWTEKDEKAVSDRIEAVLEEKSEEAVVRVDDQLSQISNEKIMAVSEFSDQILEKMEHNHSEVIFLYNMLGEKEEEIKKLVSRPVPVMEVPVKNNEVLEAKAQEDSAAEVEPPTLKEAISGLDTVALAASPKKKTAPPKKNPVKKEEKQEENQKERILNLHKKGKSVIEISRELGLGQGEVRLVIDLFQGVGR